MSIFWTNSESAISVSTQSGGQVSIELPLVPDVEGLSVTLLSGSIPDGIEVVFIPDTQPTPGFFIMGALGSSAVSRKYLFTLRATDGVTVDDRTIDLTVLGINELNWLTPSGLLPLTDNNNQYALVNTQVFVQLMAEISSRPATSLKYYLHPNSAPLPGGLALSTDGIISGVVAPIAGVQLTTFTVIVTDGLYSSSRDFSILVANPEIMLSSNDTIAASSDIFLVNMDTTTPPQWVTPPFLGRFKNDNAFALKLTAIDFRNTEADIKYSVEASNPDGSISAIPESTTLDFDTGLLYGSIEYVPDASANFKFTVRATSTDGIADLLQIPLIIEEDTRSGVSTVKVKNLSNSAPLVGKPVELYGVVYTVDSINTQPSAYDILNLNQPLLPIQSVLVSKTASVGDPGVFVNRLSEQLKETLIGRILKFTDSESYEFLDIVPYIEYEIVDLNGDIIAPAPIASGLGGLSLQEHLIQTKNLLEQTFGGVAFVTAITQSRWRIKIVSTSTTRNYQEVTAVFFGDDPGLTNFFVRLVRDNEDFIFFDINLQRQIVQGENIGLGAFADDVFNATVLQVQDSGSVMGASYSLRTFDMTIVPLGVGEVSFLSPAALGELVPNIPTTLRITATSTINDQSISFFLIDGALPPGLRLSRNGDVIGVLDGKSVPFADAYTFTVLAVDDTGGEAVKEFSLTVNNNFITPLINVYIQPLMDSDDEQLYKQFLSNPNIFNPSVLYRQNDSSFGISKDMKVLLSAGMRVPSLDEILFTVNGTTAFPLYFGGVHSAIATDPASGETIYEVVYVDVYDTKSPPGVETEEFYSIGEDTKFLSSIQNIRKRLLESYGINSEYLPIWMRTQQTDHPSGFRLAMPICYTAPGHANSIIEKITNSTFDFKQLNFVVDRIIINYTTDQMNEQFIIFHDQ